VNIIYSSLLDTTCGSGALKDVCRKIVLVYRLLYILIFGRYVFIIVLFVTLIFVLCGCRMIMFQLC
jgi:hypothetical protein